MSKSYYYLAASLPRLDFDLPLPMTTKEFLEECERLVTPKDYEDIALSLQEEPGSDKANNPVCQKWLEFERRLRNEMAWYRALEMNKDPYQHMRGDRYVEPYLVDIVVEASKAPEPLESQKTIGRTRLRYLNQLEQGHYFDLEFLIIYGLKLKLLERYSIIKSTKGEDVFKGLKEMDLPELELA